MRRVVLAAACLMLATAPAFAQTKAMIQQLNGEWAAAFNKGDAAAVAALYAEDAYVLPAGADMVKGHKAIQAFWAQTSQQLGDAKLTTIDVLSLGPGAAREIGTFSFKTKAQPPQEVVGKYAVVWRKIGGRWLLATDIWNMNK
jgi:uncharacterized protein (TIGR02246 family)